MLTAHAMAVRMTRMALFLLLSTMMTRLPPAPGTVGFFHPADVIVRMEQSSATVTEGDVVGSVCAELQALPVSGVEISVTISTTDLNAVEGEDYNLANTTIIFPGTSVVGDTACATFTITDDSILELDEEFHIQITSPTDPPGVTINVTSSTTIVAIEDNENPADVFVGLEQSSATVTEGDTHSVFVILEALPAGGTEREISVTVRTMEITAVEGEDYNLISPVITFPDMSVVGATACATFTIIDDRVLEPNNEFFRVQLTSPDPPGLTIFIPSSAAVVRIKDNEDPADVVVGMEQSSVTSTEGYTRSVCAELQALPAGGTERAIVVAIKTTGLSALEGEDYYVVNTAIIFPDTSVVGDTVCAFFIIIDDSILEQDEEFRVQITSSTEPPGLTISAQSSTTVVTIQDNEVLLVLQPVTPVNEGDIAVVCVEDMDPDISRDFNVTVTLNVISGTATAGSDFSDVSPLTLILQPNETVACVDIATIDDDLLEEDEQFTVSLGSSIPARNVTVTIIDNEATTAHSGGLSRPLLYGVISGSVLVLLLLTASIIAFLSIAMRKARHHREAQEEIVAYASAPIVLTLGVHVDIRPELPLRKREVRMESNVAYDTGQLDKPAGDRETDFTRTSGRGYATRVQTNVIVGNVYTSESDGDRRSMISFDDEGYPKMQKTDDKLYLDVLPNPTVTTTASTDPTVATPVSTGATVDTPVSTILTVATLVSTDPTVATPVSESQEANEQFSEPKRQEDMDCKDDEGYPDPWY